MTANERPQTEIAKKRAELADIEEKLSAGWILDYREEVCDVSKYRAGKREFSNFNDHVCRLTTLEGDCLNDIIKQLLASTCDFMTHADKPW